MNTIGPRFNPVNIVAACIVAAGLVAASLILAHKPASALKSVVPVMPAAKPPAPPIAQEAAQGQFRAQVLAAPKLHTSLYNGRTYTLSEVQVTQIIYSAKDDTFTILYDLSWQPAMPSSGPQGEAATLSNDGYGHYYGVVATRSGGGSVDEYAYVTIK